MVWQLINMQLAKLSVDLRSNVSEPLDLLQFNSMPIRSIADGPILFQLEDPLQASYVSLNSNFDGKDLNLFSLTLDKAKLANSTIPLASGKLPLGLTATDGDKVHSLQGQITLYVDEQLAPLQDLAEEILPEQVKPESEVVIDPEDEE